MNRLGLDVYDALALLGFVAFEYGISRWSASAAWAIGGVVLMALAVWPTRKVRR